MENKKPLSQDFFKADVVEVAQKLLGKLIEFNGVSGMIVETEAYRDDPASHGHKITKRSEIMLRTHGHVYVYFIYGMYHCLNFTTNEGEVGAVLIRALEPIEGIEEMKARRNTQTTKNLTSGPGKLCQALGITKKQNDQIIGGEIQVYEYQEIPKPHIILTPRIGITKATDLHWRFYVKDNPYVSR